MDDWEKIDRQCSYLYIIERIEPKYQNQETSSPKIAIDCLQFCRYVWFCFNYFPINDRKIDICPKQQLLWRSIVGNRTAAILLPPYSLIFFKDGKRQRWENETYKRVETRYFKLVLTKTPASEFVRTPTKKHHSLKIFFCWLFPPPCAERDGNTLFANKYISNTFKTIMLKHKT